MSKSLKKIALIVTLGTLLSKTGGLARQLLIAAAFGIGTAYDAYNYAYILPGFLLILIGGNNGPFHNAMVSILSKRDDSESSEILASIRTIVGTMLLFISLLLFIGASPIISIFGPALESDVHQVAVLQLRIMAPIAFISGLIGLEFGSLNAKDEFWIPAISPIISSISIIFGISIFWLKVGSEINSSELAIKGGIVLALSTLVGATLQWLVQFPLLAKSGLNKVRFAFNWHHPGVQEVWKVIAPATLSSGMLQINVCTDLFFASAIAGAASGLSYASLLVQAPLGLFSNALLIPLLPTFAKLTEPESKSELIIRIRQGIMFSLSSMILLAALFLTLGNPIVSLIYKRGAFDQGAVNLVSQILIAYAIGMPAYLCRDLLVRIFYCLGDSITPLRLSILGIGLNALFDWLLIGGPTPIGNQLPFNFGAPGLVIATALINLLTCLALLFKLNLKLDGLPLKRWSIDLIKLFLAGFMSGFVAWSLNIGVAWPNSHLGEVIKVSFAGCISIGLFGVIGNALGVKEVNAALIILKRKFIHQ